MRLVLGSALRVPLEKRLERILANAIRGVTEGVDRSRKVEKPHVRGPLQNAERTRDGDAAFPCNAARGLIIDQKQVGSKLESEAQGIPLSRVEFDAGKWRTRSDDLEPRRRLGNPGLHCFGRSGMRQFHCNGLRDDDTPEETAQYVDRLDQDQVVER